MKNKKILIKKIIYQSTHRGTKEMDLLLGSFVSKYIDLLNDSDLKDLEKLLFLDDQVIYNWYFNRDPLNNISNTKVSSLLKKYKVKPFHGGGGGI